MNYTKEPICCYTTYICIVQCILLFLYYYIWNKSSLLFDDFWNTWNPHPPTMLLFLRHFWRSQNNLHYMSEGPFSEIHGVRIKLQTLTYLFLIMIIRRKNYLEFRRKNTSNTISQCSNSWFSSSSGLNIYILFCKRSIILVICTFRKTVGKMRCRKNEMSEKCDKKCLIFPTEIVSEIWDVGKMRPPPYNSPINAKNSATPPPSKIYFDIER